MEGTHGGFGSFTAIEQVAATLILLSSAALYCLKSEMESRAGFRFHPTKEQIFHFLQKKRLDPRFSHPSIQDIDDICSLEPWDLAITESEAYLFNELYYKYSKSNSALKNRRTKAGSWKETGKGSKIKLTNGLTGTKKIFTFYRHGPGSNKKAKTEWVMHEFHVEDNPRYKRKFVLCHIRKKRDKKLGILTPDEGESSQQLGSPTQVSSPSDHLISCGNHIEEHSITNPNQQLIDPSNLISHPRNVIEHTVLTNQQQPTNNTYTSPFSENQIEPDTPTNPQLTNSISYNNTCIPCSENHIEPNTLANPQLLNPISYNNTCIPCSENHIEPNTLANPQLLNPISYNNTCIPCSENHIEPNTLANPQLLNSISYHGNLIEQNTFTNQNPLPSNQNMNSITWNHVQDRTLSNQQQLPPQSLEELLLPNRSLVINDVAENSFPGEHLQHGEYNGLNIVPFSAPKPPSYPPDEISYSNSPINDCDFFNSQYDSEQVCYLINSRACQDENSPEGLDKPLPSDFNSSKSDGGTYYADDSSDMDTEKIDAWIDELLVENND